MRHCGRAACTSDLSGMRADTKWCSRKCYIAVRRGARAYKAPTQSGPSGLQISFARAVDVLAGHLQLLGYSADTGEDRETSRRLMREALSDRQRARLDART